jgi:hypothetical protein
MSKPMPSFAYHHSGTLNLGEFHSFPVVTSPAKGEYIITISMIVKNKGTGVAEATIYASCPNIPQVGQSVKINAGYAVPIIFHTTCDLEEGYAYIIDINSFGVGDIALTDIRFNGVMPFSEENKKCICEPSALFNYGCKCGGE